MEEEEEGEEGKEGEEEEEDESEGEEEEEEGGKNIKCRQRRSEMKLPLHAMRIGLSAFFRKLSI